MPIIDTYTIYGFWPAGGADLSLERLKKALTGRDVELAITHSTDSVFETTSEALKSVREQLANEPGLVPAGVIDPTLLVKPWEFAAEVAQEKYACVRFFPEIHDWPIAGYAPFEMCLEALAPSGIPISVAITDPGQITALSRVSQAASLPIILAHVADDCMSEIAAVMPKMENWCLSSDGIKHLGVVDELVDVIGHERIIFGSTAPRGSIYGSINYIKYSGLSDSVKEAIFSQNARRVFGGRLANN